MELILVERRLTHKYVDSWKHMDSFKFLGRLKLTPDVQTRESDGYDDGGSYVRFARLPRGLNAGQKDEWMRAIQDSLSKWGCSHEYDCCGCSLISARAYPVAGSARDVRICTDVGFNY